MTAAEKLRELLATRPNVPTVGDLYRWWREGERGGLVHELADGPLAPADGTAEVSRVRDEYAAELLACERERLAYRDALLGVLGSARPNERDHPAMSQAWRNAEQVLARMQPGTRLPQQPLRCTGHVTHEPFTPCPVHDR